jgi:PAS domain S-box-containing protein
LKYLRPILTPPTFKDDEQTRLARLLNNILLILIALNLIDMLLLLIYAPETLPTFWTNGVLLGLNLISFWMIRRGWVNAGSLLLCVPFWVLATYYYAISGGVTSPGFGLLALLIIFGGILLGARGAVVFGALCVITGIGLYVAGNNGLLTLAEAPATPSRLFATQTTIFVSLTVMMALGSRNVAHALTRARTGEKTLAERNQQLQQEIVERERAQREQARIAAVLEATSDFAGFANMQGKTLYLNRAGRKLMGFTDDEDVSAITISDYHPPEITEMIVNQAVPSAAREGTWSGETILRTRNRGEIPVSQVLIAHRDNNGRMEFLSTIMRDLSERKQAEQTRLELALQKERVELFKEFLSNISHDLKTPLTVINTSLELLKRTQDPERQREKMDNIEQQTVLLEKYIQDLLVLSRLDHAPELSLAPTDLNQMLNEIRARLAPAFEDKMMTLKLELDAAIPRVLADHQELYRALTNLVENAVQYTPNGGSVMVQTSLDDNKVIARISDTGIGIAAKDLAHIFDRFYRAEDARQLRVKGTGLGLAIVKRIVEIHHGDIEVESTPGVGTAFRVSLPIHRAA